MAVRYVLDAYNIMHHEAYRPKGKARDPKYGLIAYVRDEGLCGSAKNTALFVFDGYPSGFEYDDGRFRAVFSGDSKADDKIKRLVETTGGREMVVVSDDREVYDFARLHGVPAKHVGEFIAGPAAPPRRDDDASKPELTFDKMRRINDELREKWLK